MQHERNFVLEFHYFMDMAQRYAVERRIGRYAAYYQIAVVIDMEIVIVHKVYKQQFYIQFIGRFGSSIVFLVEFLYNLAVDHN